MKTNWKQRAKDLELELQTTIIAKDTAIEAAMSLWNNSQAELVTMKQRHDTCAASNRLHTEEKLKLQAELNVARTLLQKASNHWVPHATLLSSEIEDFLRKEDGKNTLDWNHDTVVPEE